jgi:hypothetical protein
MWSNAEDVLKWAYNTSERPIVNTSGINRMRHEYHGAVNYLLLGFSVQDRHAQAALIISMTARLSDPAAGQYLGAKFGWRLEKNDIRLLVYRACAAAGEGLDRQAAMYQIVRGYFGEQLRQRTVRELLHCQNQRATMTRNCIYNTMDLIHNRAMAEIRETFERHGLIRSAECA